MSVLPDPADLAAIADRIAAHAAATRERAARLDRAIAGTGWTGIAANAFQLEARLATDSLRCAADRLDAAAGALQRHAARISALVNHLARFGADELGLVKDVLTDPRQVVPDTLSVVGDGVHVLGDIAGGALHAIGL